MEDFAAAFFPHRHGHSHRSPPPPSSSSSHRLSFLPSNAGGGGGSDDCASLLVHPAAAAAAAAAAVSGGGGGAGEAAYRVDSSPSAPVGTEQEEEEEGMTTAETGKRKKARKHRYAFQTRSRVDILDDGYRWRKYGQKAVKNNTFPRSYYRCTHQGCNVKKQVQRLAKDEGTVVTTYEGVHTHPIDRPTDNFEHILKQMQLHSS